MQITEKTRLEEVLKAPWAAGWEYMIDPELDSLLKDMLGEDGYNETLSGQSFPHLRLEEIPQVLSAWLVPPLEAGLRFLQEKAQQGPVFYHIWDEEERKADPSKEKTGISAFPVPGKKPFFLICPGGGYSSVCSVAEGFPIAMRLNELGYSAFILQYRVGEHAKNLNPVQDLAQAVRFLNDNKNMFGITEMDYRLVGFSAGGHLAAFFSAEYQDAAAGDVPAAKGIALGYPVVTMGEYTHPGSRELFAGENPDAETIARFSVENRITPVYPPVFMWQCDEDDTVPVENSQMLADALNRNGVRFCREMFAGSAHGWGLATGTAAEGWVDRAVAFLV